MLTVPEESVVSFAGVNKVFRVEADKVKQVEVKLGQRLTVSNGNQIENWVEVSGLLKVGDLIVVSGQNSLAENSSIKIRPSNTPSMTGIKSTNGTMGCMYQAPGFHCHAHGGSHCSWYFFLFSFGS